MIKKEIAEAPRNRHITNAATILNLREFSFIGSPPYIYDLGVPVNSFISLTMLGRADCGTILHNKLILLFFNIFLLQLSKRRWFSTIALLFVNLFFVA